MIRRNLLRMLLLVFCAMTYASCSDDEPQDKVETIKMDVAPHTGIYQPLGSPTVFEGMLVKEEQDKDYHSIALTGINGFEYEKGYQYQLLVKKITLATPMQDASSIKYLLIKILSKEKAPGDFLKIQLKYAVDAEQKEKIEEDLQSVPAVPEGSGYIFEDFDDFSAWFLVNAKNMILARGTFRREMYPYPPDPSQIFPESYSLLPPDEPIVTCGRWTFTYESPQKMEYSYDIYITRIPGALYMNRLWLYEDLTKHYQAQYPDAGVKGVVRVQKLYYNGIGME